MASFTRRSNRAIGVCLIFQRLIDVAVLIHPWSKLDRDLSATWFLNPCNKGNFSADTL